ncbi:MAG TPA: site-2 protease family protein [Thermodesulfovibrionales bacterium]|nr:site-2 protease family protein [Thermodesulfovibrionales bacterium]
MRKFPYLHLLLFVLTFFSTLVVGAGYYSVNIFKEPSGIYKGLPFSLTLMGILMSHELSHYLASRKHDTKATLPYFLPAPPIISPIGTFGAFIKMKSPIVTRRALIDIGASGPIMGFVLSVIASAIGLSYSTVTPASAIRGGINLSLGDSILFSFLTRMALGTLPESYEVVLHPVAIAGWFGLFVTSLNLIPIGQLDGGHIAYAFLKDRHKKVSLFLVGILMVLGLLFWPGWAMWGALMLALGLNHPPVVYWEVPLDLKRKLIGILAFIIFVITFIPLPLSVME